jgi:hypothetical protein
MQVNFSSHINEELCALQSTKVQKTSQNYNFSFRKNLFNARIKVIIMDVRISKSLAVADDFEVLFTTFIICLQEPKLFSL